MGKTRILKEIDQALSKKQDGAHAFLDLAWPELHLPLRIEAAILQSCTNQRARSFWELAEQYDKLQRSGNEPASLPSLLEAGAIEFARSMERLVAGNLTILIDTVDLPISTSSAVRRFFSASLPRLTKVIAVLAGRDANELARELDGLFDVQYRELPPLEGEAASAFFDGLGIEDKRRRRLVELAAGRPVFLGLAAEWLEFGTPMPDELIELGVSSSSTSSITNRNRIFQHAAGALFEEALVSRVVQLRRDLDVTLLEMARLPFRYDASIAAFLHRTLVADEERRLRGLGKLFFVKQLKPGRYMLHDEMRELINRYVWPYMDPMGTERARLDAKMAEWYSHELAVERERAAKPDVTPQLASTRVSGNEYLLRAQRFYYLLRPCASEYADEYLSELEGSLDCGKTDYAGLLIELCRSFLSGGEHDSVKAGLLEARWLRLIGRRVLSRTVLERSLAVNPPDASLRFELLLALAQALRETGEAPASYSAIREARELGRGLGPLQQAAAELADGERLLALGLVSEAVACFNRGASLLEPQLAQTDLRYQALDRAAYASSILGKRDRAQDLAEEAISGRLELGLDQGAAYSLCTLASIMRDDSRFTGAIEIYGRALIKFVEHADLHWQARVHMERGLSYLLEYEEARYGSAPVSQMHVQRSLDYAFEDLKTSVKLCRSYNREELPKALHELGHVYWERGETETTLELWEESLAASEAAGNLRYILENRIGMCELDIDARRYRDALDRRSSIQPFYYETRESHALLWSRLRKLEAEAQFHIGELEESLEGFASALAELARHGGWGRYKLEIEVRNVRNLVLRLPTAKANAWLVELRRHWTDTGSEHIPSERRRTLMNELDIIASAIFRGAD